MKVREREYGRIIGEKPPDVAGHPHMPRRMRAAQFAPFAALTGHKEQIEETQKKVQEQVEASERGTEQELESP